MKYILFKTSNMTEKSSFFKLNDTSSNCFDGYSGKRKRDFHQHLFDCKIGKNVSIVQSIKTADTFDFKTPPIREKPLKVKKKIFKKTELETTLMESFTLRKQLHDNTVTSSDFSHAENASCSVQTNTWFVTPKSDFCKDIESKNDVEVSVQSSITSGKLIGYNPSRKCGDSENRILWENPVLGVLPQNSLLSVANKRILYHSNFNKMYNSVSFTKYSLQNVQVIGQIEKQFIACALNGSSKQNVLVLVDQHAAHERIRLETFLHQIGYYDNNNNTSASKNSALKNGICRLVPPCEVLFYENEIDLLLYYTKEFNEVGLRFSVQKKQLSSARRKVYISSIPSVFVNVCQQRAEAKGPNVNELLIKEYVLEQGNLLRCGGSRKCSLSSPTIFKVLSSYACHGAIKFGDFLEQKECIGLMKQLSRCQLPFQCAHGRPSIIPLLSLDIVSSLHKKIKTCAKPKLSSLRNKVLSIK